MSAAVETYSTSPISAGTGDRDYRCILSGCANVMMMALCAAAHSGITSSNHL